MCNSQGQPVFSTKAVVCKLERILNFEFIHIAILNK